MKSFSFLSTGGSAALAAALLTIFSASTFAQVNPGGAAAPAGSKPLGAGTTGGSASERPKPLAAADKKFLRDASEAAYYELNLLEKAKGNATDASVKTLGETVNKDLQTLWGELGTVASGHNEKMATELAGGDKTKSDKLGKADASKFDKEFLKIFTRETKRLAQSFENASKSAQNPEVKAFAGKWADTVKGHATESEKVESELAKKK